MNISNVEPYELTIAEAASLLREQKLSPVALVDSVLQRIEDTEDRVHAYVTVQVDEARRAAREAHDEITAGNWKGPLHGIPIALKDLYYTEGVPTGAGSAVLEDFIPDRDSTAAARFKACGAIIIGKTVTHEFAYGQNVPPTRNPWNLECYPGGSSAGSGVSVAIDSAMGAMGTDTGGSIRVPGAVNGIVAFKPTFGRVSKFGVIPMSPTMDNAGPLAKTVEDCAIMMNAVSGYDPMDVTSLKQDVPDFTHGLKDGVKGLRLGIERDYFFYPSTMPAVREKAEKAIQTLVEQGATLVEVEIPLLEHAAAAGLTLVIADTTFVHQKWLRERPEDYEPGTRFMLELGEFIPASDYLRALQIRRRFKEAIRDVFEKNRLHALLTPTIPITTVPLDQLAVTLGGEGTETALSALVHHLTPFNLSGQPALTVPCGFSSDMLPIGLQIVGRPFDESTVLRIGQAYETATTWHKQDPPI